MIAKALQIGWYGLGSMGRPMAENLQKFLSKGANEKPLIFFNRTMASGKTLESLGASPASSFGDLVEKSDIVFTMVANDKVLQTLIGEATENNRSTSGKIFVDSSTIHPDTVKQLSESLSKHKASFVSAPVFGGPAIAAPAKLVFALAGPKDARDTVQPYILDVIGRKVLQCGEKAESAIMMKIAGNIVTLNLMEAVSEAHVFGEQAGIDGEAMKEMITESFGPVAGGYSGRMTSGAYAPSLDSRPGFGVSLSIKDANYAVDLASANKVKLPALEVAKKNMEVAREQHGECLDASSMYGTLRSEAGLGFFNGKSRQSDE